MICVGLVAVVVIIIIIIVVVVVVVVVAAAAVVVVVVVVVFVAMYYFLLRVEVVMYAMNDVRFMVLDVADDAIAANIRRNHLRVHHSFSEC